eukprot:g266.t1
MTQEVLQALDNGQSNQRIENWGHLRSSVAGALSKTKFRTNSKRRPKKDAVSFRAAHKI